MNEKAKKKISILKSPTYHVWETCASQQPVFYSYAHWTWFSENEPFTFIVQVNNSDLLYIQLFRFPPSVSQWLHPFLHLNGHSPTSQAPMSFRLRCSPSHITGPTMRQKAAEGLSKRQPVATLWFRYELALFLFCFLFLYLLLGDLLLLNHSLWLVRLRYVTQPLTPLRDEAFKLRLVSETNQLLRRQRRKSSWAG